MPLYEYECRKCGKKFEKLMLTRHAEVVCQGCGSSDIAQLLSTFSVSGGSGKAAAEPGPCGACGAPVRGSCSMN